MRLHERGYLVPENDIEASFLAQFVRRQIESAAQPEIEGEPHREIVEYRPTASGLVSVSPMGYEAIPAELGPGLFGALLVEDCPEYRLNGAKIEGGAQFALVCAAVPSREYGWFVGYLTARDFAEGRNDWSSVPWGLGPVLSKDAE